MKLACLRNCRKVMLDMGEEEKKKGELRGVRRSQTTLGFLNQREKFIAYVVCLFWLHCVFIVARTSLVWCLGFRAYGLSSCGVRD